MDFSQISALQNLLDTGENHEDEFANVQKGSVLNPGTIAGKDKKEVAKPYAKIQTTVNERNTSGGAKPPATKAPTDIWSADEVKDVIIDKRENRLTPEFDIMFRQKVGAQDVYLGMSDIDPSSNKCQELLMKIKLPNTTFKDVALDVTEQAVCVQSSKYFLYHILPYPVNEKEGKAQWLSDKNILQITLPIIREDPF